MRPNLASGPIDSVLQHLVHLSIAVLRSIESRLQTLDASA